MAIAVLPMLRVGGLQLFKVDAFETPGKSAATCRTGSQPGLPSSMSALLSSGLLAAGSSTWIGVPAVSQAMTTIATGG